MPIHFNMNTQKAIEVILWIIYRGESNMYNIWKIMFSAEKYHLNNHGRPITGDTYIAMDYGTVPSWLYDIAKENRYQSDFSMQNNKLTAKRKPDMEYFSESDVEALEYGFNQYAKLDFKSVMEKNHKEPAWEKSYTKGNGTPILFEDLIEEEWLKEELSLFSGNLVL